MTSLTQNRITTAVALLFAGCGHAVVADAIEHGWHGYLCSVCRARHRDRAHCLQHMEEQSADGQRRAAHTRRRRDIVAHCPRCGGPDERGAVGRRAEPLGSICAPGSRARMAGAQRCRHGRTAVFLARVNATDAG